MKQQAIFEKDQVLTNALEHSKILTEGLNYNLDNCTQDFPPFCVR